MAIKRATVYIQEKEIEVPFDYFVILDNYIIFYHKTYNKSNDLIITPDIEVGRFNLNNIGGFVA